MPFRIAMGLTAEEEANFQLSQADRVAWSIMISEIDGLDFNWDTLTPRPGK